MPEPSWEDVAHLWFVSPVAGDVISQAGFELAHTALGQYAPGWLKTILDASDPGSSSYINWRMDHRWLRVLAQYAQEFEAAHRIGGDDAVRELFRQLDLGALRWKLRNEALRSATR